MSSGGMDSGKAGLSDMLRVAMNLRDSHPVAARLLVMSSARLLGMPDARAKRRASVQRLASAVRSHPSMRPEIVHFLHRLSADAFVTDKRTFKQKADELGISVELRIQGNFFAQQPHGSAPDVIADVSGGQVSVQPLTPRGDEFVQSLS